MEHNLTGQFLDIEKFHFFDKLDILAKHIVEGFITGLHRSPYHGFSVEFAEHRLYNEGESTKNIDWKLYARTDKYFVKRYEEETNLRTQIVIDCSSSMLFPYKKGGIDKLGFSALMGAALTYLLKRQRDAIGLSLFTDKLEEHILPKLASSHIQLMYSKFAQVLKQKENLSQAEAMKRPNATPEILHQIAENIHKRSLVVVFTDLFDSADSEDVFSALQHLKYNKHEVILFHVTDRSKEVEFDFPNRPTKFVDLETGESLKLTPGQIREKYSLSVKSYFEDIKLKCTQLHIDFCEADISAQEFDQVLLSYLIKRNKLF